MKRNDVMLNFPGKEKVHLLREQRGFTLVEIMVVVVVISLLALFAAPDLINWRPRMNLKAASEELFTNMQLAKIHAIKNNVDVDFTFTIAAPCPGGSYTFDEVVSGNNVASGVMANDVCLSSSTFVAGEGFTPRSLPIITPGGGIVTLTHARVTGVQFQIQQSIAGGVTVDKL